MQDGEETTLLNLRHTWDDVSVHCIEGTILPCLQHTVQRDTLKVLSVRTGTSNLVPTT